jgi:lactate dehydrogenase-like 2-hydroxyacid dehydrogenase
MSATVLVLVETIGDYLPLLEAAGFRLIVAPTPQTRADAVREHAEQITAVLTRGPLGLRADEIDALHKLEIITVIGAGYEQVDLAAAQRRGIVVTNGAGVNASSVADHALALLLASVRNVPQLDALVRRSGWTREMRPSLAGKRLGVLGLGAVGMAIAKRCTLGFDMQVSYHNRRPRLDVGYQYCATVLELAAHCDFLVVATPGGSGTEHLVGSAELQALGRDGFIVNIARASVIDTAALLQALQSGQIAGAGLDVFDDEPRVQDAFKTLGNVVLTPHVAGLSPDAVEATVVMVIENLRAYFAGLPVLTPVGA